MVSVRNALLTVVLLSAAALRVSHAQSGDNETDPLVIQFQQLSSVVSELKTGINETESTIKWLEDQVEHKVAFTAYMTDDKNETSQGDVIFEQVVSNVGNGYNSTTGHFRAPYGGDYFFLVTVTCSADYE